MTTQELQNKAKLIKPLIDALVDGKTVQVSYSNKWNDLPCTDILSDLIRDINPNGFRIKPREPMEIWYCHTCSRCVASMHKETVEFSNHRVNHYKEVIN